MSSKHKPEQRPNTSRSISDETIVKIAKEITVKFIEVGRVTPASFDKTFMTIYTTVEKAVSKDR